MPSRKKNDTPSQDDGQGLAPLHEALATISRSLAVIALRLSPVRHEDKSQQIHFLNGLGLGRHEIAEVIRTTPNTVSVTLSTGRGKKTKKARQGGKNRR